MRISLVAVDAGPRQVLHALAKVIPEAVGVAQKAASLESTEMLIVGTSGSAEGVDIEGRMRCAAVQESIPLVVVEDYPGNYFHIEGGKADLLVVDSPFSRDIHRKKLGNNCPEIRVLPNPRYDPYRITSRRMRALLSGGWERQKNNAAALLWIGQPETAYALETLNRAWSVLQDCGIKLLFKAHPRDQGYREGAYRNFFDNIFIDVVDVTAFSLEECCERHYPRALITQFSSMAIEAGYYGIPALHLLYPDVGGGLLQQQKGFPTPPWCAAGAAICLSDTSSLGAALQKVMGNSVFRADLIEKFDLYFGGNTIAKRWLSEIRDFINRG